MTDKSQIQLIHVEESISNDSVSTAEYGIPVSAVEVGQWYWVMDDRYGPWLGCAMSMGSNFVEINSPRGAGGYMTTRIHFAEVMEKLRYEPNAEDVIKKFIIEYRDKASKHLEEVKEITARLGVSNQAAIGRESNAPGTALMTLSGQEDVKSYENALVVAKKKLLPELFKEIEKANSEMTRWMAAEMMPLLAQADGYKDVIEEIEDRIFNVSLYAGLVESVHLCKEGAAAQYHEKLHVLQRKLYMDEECLANYKAGGMEFKNLPEFEDWLSETENFNRIFPFNRCMVAMQVRRKEKAREWDGSLSGIVNISRMGISDKFTFLYIRNGEQMYRLETELEFGEMIFPDLAMFNPSEPMMVKMFAHRVDKMISVSDYEERLKTYKSRKELHDKWEAENPEETWNVKERGSRWGCNPYRYSDFNPRDWAPVNDTNRYFDECKKDIEDRIKKYNRIALIIQGLFDRSEVLHPHAPAKTWTPDGFDACIKLIYDGSMVISNGEKPDFEAYRSECNASMCAGSMVVGQEEFWLLKEGAKESERRDKDWRYSKETYRPKTFEPRGNPGPGHVTAIADWKPRSRMAVFKWKRERQREDSWSGKWQGDPIDTSLTVPESALFNVSAYKAGDYKRFLGDSRTRQEYLKWAPFLMAAEDYVNGKLKK